MAVRFAKSVSVRGLGDAADAAASPADVEAAHQKLIDSADKLADNLDWQYISGGIKIGLAPDRLKGYLGLGLLGWLFGPSDNQLSIEHNYGLLGGYIKEWSSTRRGWAEAGMRDDGSAYTWEKWTWEGTEYAKAIPDYIKMSWDYSSVVQFAEMVVQDAKDYANLLVRVGAVIKDPSTMPDWIKWSLWGLGAVAVLLVYRDISPAVKASAAAVRAGADRARKSLSGRRRR